MDKIFYQQVVVGLAIEDSCSIHLVDGAPSFYLCVAVAVVVVADVEHVEDGQWNWKKELEDSHAEMNNKYNFRIN